MSLEVKGQGRATLCLIIPRIRPAPALTKAEWWQKTREEHQEGLWSQQGELVYLWSNSVVSQTPVKITRESRNFCSKLILFINYKHHSDYWIVPLNGEMCSWLPPSFSLTFSRSGYHWLNFSWVEERLSLLALCLLGSLPGWLPVREGQHGVTVETGR